MKIKLRNLPLFFTAIAFVALFIDVFLSGRPIFKPGKGADLDEKFRDRINYIKQGNPVGQEKPDNNKKAPPLCLIGIWSGATFPIYYRLFADSIIRNEDYVHLFMFTHAMSRTPNNSPNIEYIDIASINASYKARGWPGFLADRLCGKGKVWDTGTLQECEDYEKGLSGLTHLMIQFRGLYGRLFSEWVNPHACNAWSWVDIDVVFGDLKYWFYGNPLAENADVWTIGGGDLERHYIRGQLSVHNFKGPHGSVVNDLWKRCWGLNHFPNKLDTDSLGQNYFVVDEVLVCSVKDQNKCREKFKTITQAYKAASKSSTVSLDSSASRVFSLPPSSAVKQRVDTGEVWCMGWVPKSNCYCLVQDFSKDLAFIPITVQKDSQIELRWYPKVRSSLFSESGDDSSDNLVTAVQKPGSNEVYESPMMHFQYWKKDSRHPETPELVPVNCNATYWDSDQWRLDEVVSGVWWGTRIHDMTRKC